MLVEIIYDPAWVFTRLLTSDYEWSPWAMESFIHPTKHNSLSSCFHWRFAQGSCPACKKQFAGYKNQIVRCTSCGNIVWQRQGDFFPGGRKGTTPSSSKSDPEIIDVEFEEK